MKSIEIYRNRIERWLWLKEKLRTKYVEFLSFEFGFICSHVVCVANNKKKVGNDLKELLLMSLDSSIS